MMATFRSSTRCGVMCSLCQSAMNEIFPSLNVSPIDLRIILMSNWFADTDKLSEIFKPISHLCHRNVTQRALPPTAALWSL